jgi:hypothetical protein
MNSVDGELSNFEGFWSTKQKTKFENVSIEEAFSSGNSRKDIFRTPLNVLGNLE